ncbi:uncharacterized protein LOC133896046 [Phragmites australis]|uniref:uncharacterized protein LOC133896046 n=1 Tax=Phragmites australis TaxID=29695 RepID=UPI002D76DA85|nr:uncharacterized protein LOC133896046 [Phragmites australis]
MAWGKWFYTNQFVHYETIPNGFPSRVLFPSRWEKEGDGNQTPAPTPSRRGPTRRGNLSPIPSRFRRAERGLAVALARLDGRGGSEAATASGHSREMESLAQRAALLREYLQSRERRGEARSICRRTDRGGRTTDQVGTGRYEFKEQPIEAYTVQVQPLKPWLDQCRGIPG